MKARPISSGGLGQPGVALTATTIIDVVLAGPAAGEPSHWC
ncbi:MAG: hypothetical protein ACM3MK_05235 [Chitinophagales bacterium]